MGNSVKKVLILKDLFCVLQKKVLGVANRMFPFHLFSYIYPDDR